MDRDPQVRILDLTNDFTNADGTLRKNLFTPDTIHLSPAGYAVYAERLKPLLDKLHGGQGLGGEAVVPKFKASATTPAPAPSQPPTSTAPTPRDSSLPEETLKPTPKTAGGRRE